ncbi:hypothetical protein C4544_04340 [candidate division WS5 bacterium]|uniref:Uncharacterized protein n=1 Tax=candidate division WS5 bacterium TaxID=2093353 RepID=A0A419DCL5_9BACT|nr:MAG: hypothetical protein C4544_04340 [candidate division WS5 bacterium]
MEKIIKNCRILLSAYEDGKLGQTVMPEDSNPGFSKSQIEQKLSYFTLPMSLNYQRNSYELWKSALKTYEDRETRGVFDIREATKMSENELRKKLIKYKVALQPKKHISNWQTISQTVYKNWGSFSDLIKESENDFLKLKQIVQKDYKKGFPYLSGPKIFNYWSFIINKYCGVKLKNAEFIDIAPDTHITKCSVILNVISEDESEKLSKDEISERWRRLLSGTDINPIDMHPPLWFWSRNGFIFDLEE